MQKENRLLHSNWDLYDTRHAVFQPAQMTIQELEAGYWNAYRDFYQWPSIFAGAKAKAPLIKQLRHVAYAGGWKKFEPLWDLLIRAKQVGLALPILENVLSAFGNIPSNKKGLLALANGARNPKIFETGD
jgi:hypothetical protein